MCSPDGDRWRSALVPPIITRVFARLRRYLRHRRYVVGRTLTRFLAPDILRDVEIVDASELDDGFVTARIRTWNVLYVHRGISVAPEPSPPRRIAIAELWTWTGEPWGGPIPDDDLGSRP